MCVRRGSRCTRGSPPGGGHRQAAHKRSCCPTPIGPLPCYGPQAEYLRSLTVGLEEEVQREVQRLRQTHTGSSVDEDIVLFVARHLVLMQREGGERAAAARAAAAGGAAAGAGAAAPPGPAAAAEGRQRAAAPAQAAAKAEGCTEAGPRGGGQGAPRCPTAAPRCVGGQGALPHPSSAASA